MILYIYLGISVLTLIIFIFLKRELCVKYTAFFLKAF